MIFLKPCSPLHRLPLYLVSLFISLLFLLVNLTCAVLVRTENSERKVIVSVRVAINDTLFVLCAISLSVCLYKISKMSLANIYLESKVKQTSKFISRLLLAKINNLVEDASGLEVFGFPRSQQLLLQSFIPCSYQCAFCSVLILKDSLALCHKSRSLKELTLVDFLPDVCQLIPASTSEKDTFQYCFMQLVWLLGPSSKQIIILSL